MKRHILTGAPGAGKTVLLRALERRGYAVVEEAATDVNLLAQARGVDEPWRGPSFIDDIVALQRARQLRADRSGETVVVFDRSPICTWALAEHLGLEPSAALREEVERIQRERTYERLALFIQNLGFCQPTAVRRISFEDTLRFEQTHADVYRRFGYELVLIAPGDLSVRLQAVIAEIGGPNG
jgi:predicted ATPase